MEANTESASSQFDLPDGVLTELCKRFGMAIGDVLNLSRLSAQFLRPCRGAVKTLIAEDAVLPPTAWQAFPEADGLRIALHSTAGSSRQECETAISAMSRAAAILSQAPHKLKRLMVLGEPSAPAEPLVTSLITAHGKEAALFSLEELQMDVPLRPEAAASLLAALHSLRRAYLRIDNNIAPTAAAAVDDDDNEPEPCRLRPSSTLNALYLEVHAVPLDLTDISSCSELQKLTITNEDYDISVRLCHLANLQQLSSLELDCLSSLPDDDTDWAQIFSALVNLKELSIPFVRCSSPMWQALAQLQHLQTVGFCSLSLDAAAPSPVKHVLLSGMRGLLGNEDDDDGSIALAGAAAAEPRGLLARLMPQLETISIAGEMPADLMGMMLLGCSELVCVRFEPVPGFGAEFAAAMRTCPKLQEVKFMLGSGWEGVEVDEVDADGLLDALKDLEQLRSVQLGRIGRRVTPAGVAALATGRACDSLQNIGLTGSGMAVVAQLLASLAKPCTLWLGEVLLDVPLPDHGQRQGVDVSWVQAGVRGMNNEQQVVVAAVVQRLQLAGVRVVDVGKVVLYKHGGLASFWGMKCCTARCVEHTLSMSLVRGE